MTIARPVDRSSARLPSVIWIAAAGDLIEFAVFVAIGDHTHHDGPSILHAVGVVAPFLVGWYGVGAVTGMFRRDAFSKPTRAAVLTLRTWIPALIIAMILRSIGEGRLVHPGFVIVALVWNALFLSAWHAALARFSPAR